MREFDLNGLRLAEYQGKIFESSVDYPSSSSIFVRRFFHSNFLDILDHNDLSKTSLDVDEALSDIEMQFGKSSYGKVKASKESMFWLGYFLRYISYTRGVSTRFIMKTFPYKDLLSRYYVYHTQDMEWCISNLLSDYGLDQRFFDPNYRFEMAIREKYKLPNN